MSGGADVDLAGLRARFFHRCDRLVPDGGLGIAVSGGGDSMALLSLATAWARTRGRSVAAITIDHGLRLDAAKEADLVATVAARLGVPHTIRQADLGFAKTGPGNLMAAARTARYRLMADWAAARDLSAVAVGHTLDDQAETVLMRLGRGSGVDGLSAMSETRDWFGVRWIRPLLDTARADLRAWLRAADLPWAEDPSNDDPSYDRVAARRALAHLAPLGITAAGLAETAAILRQQRVVLEQADRALAETALRHGDYGEARLSPIALFQAPVDLRRRLLMRAICAVTGAAQPPRHRSLIPVLDALAARQIPRATLAGALLTAHRRGLLVAREPAAALAQPVPAEPGMVWDRRWELTGPETSALFVRALGDLRPEVLPCDWRAVPAVVRKSLPALVSLPTDRTEPPVLRAIPAFGWASGMRPWRACFVGAQHDL